MANMSAENPSKAAPEPPESPKVVEKATSTVAKPKPAPPKPAPPKPAPRAAEVETAAAAAAGAAPAVETRESPCAVSDVLSVFGWEL